MTEAKRVKLDFSLGRSEYNRRFRGSMPGRPPSADSDAYRTSYSVALTMACMYPEIGRNIAPPDVAGFEERARAVRGWTAYAVRRHHKVANGSAQDVRNEIVAAIVTNTMVTFFDKGRFREYEGSQDLDSLGKMLKDPGNKGWSDLAGHMMGFPEMFATVRSKSESFLPVEVCGERQCGFAEFCTLYPFEMSGLVRSEAPFLPESKVSDSRLEDVALSLVGMCGAIDHGSGVLRLDSPGASAPFPELPYMNVIAFGHFQSLSEEGMQGSDPVRLYRVYDDRLPYVMDLRHYPRTLENEYYENSRVKSPVESVKDPFVIIGALNPFARRWVRHVLRECGLKPCKIEEKMLEADPDMEPPGFEDLVRFIDMALMGDIRGRWPHAPSVSG
ncbi:MAG: hypothetical protein IKQ60_06725 [Candidatus Methanomethylophilaceae archaeon]|nr:hypothetical protein [Candidatus Methanomethylophilaceae archaeon]